MKREIRLTGDHSSTLFVPELDEHYHSVHGALQESLHVFLRSGLDEFKNGKSHIHILEVGLGTGLNAWLSLEEALKHSLHIRYTALEKYPLENHEVEQLNYAHQLDGHVEYFTAIHEAQWGKEAQLFKSAKASFSLHKIKTDLKEFKSEPRFDLIYFDAFAPSAQPDLWTASIFTNMFQALKPGGLLVTYCVKGEVRRAMQEAGFAVEKIPGPPGKREMARAWKKTDV